jgi:hypothetical protein
MEDPTQHVTIKIKRRTSGEPGPPPSLAHGELAFNEVSNTLFIGSTQTKSVSSQEW